MLAHDFSNAYYYIDNSSDIWKVINGSDIIWTDNLRHIFNDDGVLPTWVQNYNGATSNITVPSSTNHFLVTQTDDGKRSIESAFSLIGFQNTPVSPTVSISPTSSATPAGGAYQFSANIS